MFTVDAYAMPAPGQPFQKTTIERRDPTETDVVIDIKFAGICHSDIHTGRNEWGHAHFPLVTGHEIAGVVSQIGSAVTKFKVGDRVGVGCLVDSCRQCENCKNGNEQYCTTGATGTYNSLDKFGKWTDGGYSKAIVVDQDFVLRIPDSIELDVAAPLLCAGITLYSPLCHWNASTAERVGIIGLGGLGHMGVQIAHAMGTHVTTFSRTMSKKKDALALGSNDYIATESPSALKATNGSFDLIVNTASAITRLDPYVRQLKTDGTLVIVGLPEKPVSISAFALTGNRRSISGSNIGGIQETQEMLDFCASHNITPRIEIINADQIDAAWDRVVASDVRYRFVIDISSI